MGLLVGRGDHHDHDQEWEPAAQTISTNSISPKIFPSLKGTPLALHGALGARGKPCSDVGE